MTPPFAGARSSGKFLEVDGCRFLVKGVTYGTFAPDEDGGQFPPLKRIDQDFGLMAEAGINTVRVYTVPDTSLLDAALRHGLKVMVGVPWTQHVAFLDDAALTREVRFEAVAAVRQVAAHPATLLCALGNEIPAPIVRWHGQARVERFLRDLYDACKQAAPHALLTYVNFRPRAFELDVFDVCSFNVYLHRPEDLRAYLARLQRRRSQAAAARRSRRRQHPRGPDGQARITAMHVRRPSRRACAGRWRSRGLTSGGAAGRRSTTGRSGSSTPSAARSRRSGR